MRLATSTTFSGSDTVGVTNFTDANYQHLTTITPGRYVTSAVKLLLGAAGVASFIYLLWGGVQYITSAGDKEGFDKARRKIVHALIGLAIVFSSYALLFLIQITFNINVIGFNLGSLNSYTSGGVGGPVPTANPSTQCDATPNPPVGVGTCSCGTDVKPYLCLAPGATCPATGATYGWATWCPTACKTCP